MNVTIQVLEENRMNSSTNRVLKQNKTKLLVILKPNTINEKTDKFKYTIKIEQKTKYRKDNQKSTKLEKIFVT